VGICNPAKCRPPTEFVFADIETYMNLQATRYSIGRVSSSIICVPQEKCCHDGQVDESHGADLMEKKESFLLWGRRGLVASSRVSYFCTISLLPSNTELETSLAVVVISGNF
jgi:hypothetical protein